ncbi:hypothetical protein [Acidocella sp.]|uniref:hypothetical protein n=1 Tax=Acidocella sp. TaxID=50710 RepID=UPI002F423708
MSQKRQKPYSFVLWAIPRFHRGGPARGVSTKGTGGEISASERSLQDEDKAKPVTRPAGKAAPWRYALS